MARTAAPFAHRAALQAALGAAEGSGATPLPIRSMTGNLTDAPQRGKGPRGERELTDDLGRHSGRYDLIGNPVGTLMNVPLGGYVRSGLANAGLHPEAALWGERAAAAGVAGVGAATFLAAVQTLNDNTQTPGTIPIQ